MAVGGCGWWAVGRGLSVGRGWRLAVGFVFNLALKLHCGHEATVLVHCVGDLLDAAVGQQHVEGALGVVAVAGLRVAEVVAGVIVLDGPVEVVGGFLQRGSVRVTFDV